KLVNLDMEEHRDLDLTVAVFTAVLDRPEFHGLTAGIALQAYLPDTHGALDELLEFASRRIQAGAAPIRIRLVKGANLAMERVEAELHGWPLAVYPSKADTDASYKRLLLRLVDAARRGDVRVGVASHNLFDVALALELAAGPDVELEIEMLVGMADGQSLAVTARAGGMLVYVPATTRRDYRNALAYLARRLDENATPEGFLRHALDLVPGGAAWDDQVARFAAAMDARHGVRTRPFQTQDRAAEVGPPPPASVDIAPVDTAPVDTGFANEPDTDLTIAANRDWARRALAAPARPAPPICDEADVDAALTRARAALPGWSATYGAERRRLLERAAAVFAAGRADSVAVMAAETGKTFAESDPEISEAVDYARWYGRGAVELDGLHESFDGGPAVGSEPVGVVVVASPWNFPYAIPAGGVLAALAAGNVVLLKPSPEAHAAGALLVDQLHEAGFGRDVVQLVATEDGPTGQRLITDHRVGAIVLTGSLDTALLFRRWVPERRLLAETSGKNALVVTATADVDQAVRDLVRSAFGHAGQKCSAASLAIVDASLHDRSPFLRQLADAVRSLRVGPAIDPASEVGPIVGPFTHALERVLTRLDPGESWLVEPRVLDADRRLWSPGVRLGVQPGSWAHLTEWFGPVVGVMRARDLDEALRWQNAIPFGLTAGLHSLDPEEHQRWADAVEAGNLYVNRHTTGAIVGRQPFGGWKGSSVGPTAKTGGPNYLFSLRRWSDAAEGAAPVSVDQARRSYEHWWRTCFSRETELMGFAAEANVLRYRPFTPGVELRVGVGATEDEVAKAVAASRLTGTPVRVSRSAEEDAAAFSARLRAGHGADQDADHGAGHGAGRSGARLRLLGVPEPEVVATAAELGVTVLDEPVCSHGRVELVRWLREQAVSRSLHRYGNLVYDR
ncbi:MAG TPA: bifunctional proline dehydrogenase/L-glutamate gamma-semialdehyde dehydrogenase, partial [Acidimicrobiales bacterium]|nr:bifunctional proline dehydrogenase/L-glutamate gamma-semialdehyde dehydrogenase [Acidimicrobiales bacterium]